MKTSYSRRSLWLMWSAFVAMAALPVSNRLTRFGTIVTVLAGWGLLTAIMRPRSPFLRAYGPRLRQPPSRARFIQVLSAYAGRDKVPRVQQRTAGLISNADNHA